MNSSPSKVEGGPGALHGCPPTPERAAGFMGPYIERMSRVLVIEDEPSIAGIVAHKLRREGHEIRCEESLDETVLEEWRPELILFDLEPEESLETLRRFSGGWRFLALTGFRDEIAPGQAREAGAVATLAKPFKPTVLARLVAELTRS